MRKILITAVSVIVTFTIAALIILNKGGNTKTLYLLNWGEYIDEELFDAFEDETGIQVVQECVTSSETMYQKISAGTTAYDVAIPGDYMITKLYNDNLLYKIDTKNYDNLKNYQTKFDDNLTAIRQKEMADTMEYCMPYFWGAYSMVYSTRYDGNRDVVTTNGFKALFDKSLYKDHKAKTGMYNTARWAISAYYMSVGIDPNDEGFVTDNAKKSTLVKAMKDASFDMWGDDALKRKTASGDIDICFTQLGDFFDAVYLALDEGMGGNIGLDKLPFDVYVPANTAAFFDGMCIPKTSKHQEYANKFINFMLDTDNAFDNALAIGYSPALKSVQQMFVDNPDEEYFSNDDVVVTLKDLTDKYPFYLNPLVSAADINDVKMLQPKESEYLTACEAVINQVKANVSENKTLGTTLCILALSTIILGAGAYITVILYKKYKKEQNVA